MEVEDTVTPTEETQELENTPDMLDMSDEEFEQFMASEADTAMSEPEEDPEPAEEAEDTEESDESDNEDTDEAEPEDEVTEPEGDDPQTDETSDDEADTESHEDPESEEGQTDTDGKPTETAEIDYKAEYEKLLAPFKANGRDIKVDSVDDAMTLMRMGANYNKKMAALKPNMRVLKALENNGLLDETKVNYLVDLAQKKPEAIAKLIKESQIDPLDIDTEQADSYVPTSHGPSDQELAIDDVLDSIKDNESFGRTMKVVTDELDAESRALLVQQPDVISALDQHIQNGIYDQIMGEVEKERMFGRLKGVSDLEAYKTVGDRLHAQGAFGTEPTVNQEPTIPEPVSKKPDPKVVAKKKAAGSVRSRPAKKQPEFDPLSMSDEEFEQLAGSGLYS